MNFFSKLLLLLGLFWAGHLNAQDCTRLVDSLSAWGDKGEFLRLAAAIDHVDSICLREVGEEDSVYASVLSLRGALGMVNGDFKGSNKWSQQAKKISLRTRGLYNQHTSIIFSNDGFLLMQMGQLSQALAAFDTALMIKKHLKDTSMSLGTTYLGRGQTLIGLGRYSEAKEDLDFSLRNALANGIDKNGYQYLIRVNTLGVVLDYMGQAKQATPMFKESLRTATLLFGEDNPTAIQCLHNLAQNCLTANLLDSALIHAQTAMRLALKNMPDQVFTDLVRNNLGLIYLQKGQYSEALDLFLKAKAIDEKSKRLDPANLAVLFNNLGNTYLQTLDYASALPYLNDARVLFEKSIGTKNARYAIAVANIATCHYYLGNSNLAKKLADEAFSLVISYGEDFPSFERLLLNTAISAPKTEKSLEVAQRVMDISAKKFGAQSKVYAASLANYGMFLTKLDRYKEGLAILEQAEKLLVVSAKKTSKDYLDVSRNIAGCHAHLGNSQKAANWFRQALDLTQKSTGTENAFYAHLLQALAGEEDKQCLPKQAYAHYLGADTLYRRIAQRNFAVLSEAGREAFWEDVRPQIERWHSFAWRHIGSFPELPGILYDDELAQKGQLLHSARTVLASLRADSALTAKMKTWVGLLQTIDAQRALLISPSDTPPLYNAAQLDSLGMVADLLESQLAQSSNTFATAARPVHWREVQSCLAPDEAAVEFFRFQYHKPEGPTDSVLYGALVLRPGERRPRYVPLFEEGQLAALLERTGLDNDEWVRKCYPARSKAPSDLYGLLWKRLEPHLALAKRVWYAPVGLLHQVSFPALSQKQGDRLLAHVDLQQLGSTRELLTRPKTKDAPPASGQIYACISYPPDSTKMHSRYPECLGSLSATGLRKGEGTPHNLPYTLGEANTVAVCLRAAGSKVFIAIGYQPLEEDIKKSLDGSNPSPAVLMFATHGFAQDSLPQAFKGRYPPSNPMYASGLLLAGSRDVWGRGVPPVPGFEDGLLTAREVGELNLSHTRLIILSACQSGLGKATGSEGVYGLQRAFKMAGARQVLATLWEIPDSPDTRDFVGQFCQRWLQSGDPRAALRDTQRAFYLQGKDVQVWGAWVLI